jgi:TonB family protein
MIKFRYSLLIAVFLHIGIACLYIFYTVENKAVDVSTLSKIELKLSRNHFTTALAKNHNQQQKKMMKTSETLNTANSREHKLSNTTASLSTGAENFSSASIGDTESDFSQASENYVNPSYPKMAIKRGLEGNVRIRIKLSAEGLIEATEILKSSGHESLDKAVLDSVHQWKFRKRESAYFVEKTVIFKLKN